MGTETVRVAELKMPLGAVAVIWAEPAVRAEDSPLLLIEATAAALEDQVKLTVGMMLP